jgi:hypothetical protein
VSEGYVGFWTLNRLSRPVRINADLLDGRTGLVVWHGVKTGLAGWQWRHLVYMNEQMRDELLARSMRKAATAVITAAAHHAQLEFD